MKSILYSILLFFSAQTFAVESLDELAEALSRSSGPDGEILKLEILMSFDGTYTFEMYKDQGKYFLESSQIIYKHLNDNQKETLSTRYRDELDSNDVEIIYEKLESALVYNTLASESGLDGSNWCLEAYRGGSYTKGCFWTPSSGSESRGLKSLFLFGVYLIERANFQYENLY